MNRSQIMQRVPQLSISNTKLFFTICGTNLHNLLQATWIYNGGAALRRDERCCAKNAAEPFGSTPTFWAKSVSRFVCAFFLSSSMVCNSKNKALVSKGAWEWEISPLLSLVTLFSTRNLQLICIAALPNRENTYPARNHSINKSVRTNVKCWVTIVPFQLKIYVFESQNYSVGYYVTARRRSVFLFEKSSLRIPIPKRRWDGL